VGTKFTMQEDFYRKRLTSHFGLEILLPPAGDIEIVNTIIFEELVRGIVRESSRAEYYRIMDSMKANGAEGIILGCTEIGLLLRDYTLSLYDSTVLHAAQAVEFSLGL